MKRCDETNKDQSRFVCAYQLSRALQSSFRCFAEENWRSRLFQVIGYGRHYCDLRRSSPQQYAQSLTLQQEVMNQLGLGSFQIEPEYGNFIDISFPHSKVPRHIDSAPDGFILLRCNFFLQKPEQGGEPIIEGEILQIQERSAWLVPASLCFHASTPVRGETNRIILSLGALLSRAHIPESAHHWLGKFSRCDGNK